MKSELWLDPRWLEPTTRVQSTFNGDGQANDDRFVATQIVTHSASDARGVRGDGRVLVAGPEPGADLSPRAGSEATQQSGCLARHQSVRLARR